MEHVDGFIGHWPLAVLDLLGNDPPPQFYQLANWTQLMTRCDCCPAQYEDVYIAITADEAKAWAMGRLNG